MMTAVQRTLTILFLGALLGGCGMVRDDVASNMMVTPGKYRMHNCFLLGATLKHWVSRTKELETLIARASQAPGGTVIGSQAYRTELLWAKGEEKELVAEIGAKNCKSESNWSSDRTVY